MTECTIADISAEAKARAHVDSGQALVVPEIGLTEIEGEPRARDVELGERLGFGRPRDIRPLIERHIAEIEAFGCARHRAAHMEVRMPKGGTRVETVEEFWLNEEQALLVSILSEAPNAPAVRAMLIKTFVAWRRGRLIAHHDASISGDDRKIIGGIVKSVIHKEMADVLPAMVEAAMAADPRRAVLNYVSVRQLLDDAKALQKGRNRVNRKIGFELRERAMMSTPPAPLRKCAHSGVWLYPKDFATVYMAERGRSLVADHNSHVTGQGVIRFPAKQPPA